MFTRRDVQQAATRLASEAWEHREDLQYLQRADEIRRLVIDQLADDSPTTKRKQHRRTDRIGRRIVEVYDNLDHGAPMWPARTDDQLALEKALLPLLESTLSGEQRVLVRWRYAGQLTTREIGDLLSISHVAVQKRLRVIHDHLRSILLSAFGPKETS